MKRTQVRALTLAILLTLTLCLLPTVAGAVYLEPTELEFIVGEPANKSVRCRFNEVEDGGPNIGIIPNDKEEQYGLRAVKTEGSVVTIEGTPTKAGDYVQGFLVIYGNADPIKLEVHIFIRAKETPVAPAAPVDRPEIPDYSRCEQALIRGVKEWCNIRQRADINSDVTGRATLGQRISLICWNEDETWCFVDCGGEQGWIAKQFILPIK